jgi:hypothetical protein
MSQGTGQPKLLHTIHQATPRAFLPRPLFSVFLFDSALLTSRTTWKAEMGGGPQEVVRWYREERARVELEAVGSELSGRPAPSKGEVGRAVGDAFDERLREVQERTKNEAAEVPLTELAGRHPDNRLIPLEEVARVRLRKGVIDSALTVALTDGTRLKRVWTSGDGWRRSGSLNPPFEETVAAFRLVLGPKLMAK